MSTFWQNVATGTEVSYDDLVDRVSSATVVPTHIQDETPAESIIKLIESLVFDHPVTLIDPSFDEATLSEVGVQPADLADQVKVDSRKITDADDLVSRAMEVDSWSLTVFTSGTTGTPTPVTQTYDSLTRNTKVGERFRDDTWAFAYNPTHFAGLQVFFQAFLNTNPMVYVFDSPRREAVRALQDNEVTHVSATPTFYRTRLLPSGDTFDSVRRVTFGGEKFDPGLHEELARAFPNAEIRNVYASTEAGSLLESDSDEFHVPPEISEQVRVGKEGELLIHESLLGTVHSDTFDGGWFQTGDVVERTPEGGLRFVGRKSEFVNVGGTRVNPHVIEERIKQHDGILDATVRARENSVTGNVLTAELVVQSDEAKDRVDGLRERLESELEPQQIPRIIDVVDSLDKTRSGKKQR